MSIPDAVRFVLWSIAASVLLTVLNPAAANANPMFDKTKRAVLPSEAATTILEWYVADGRWSTSEWAISSEDLDRVEFALGSAIEKPVFRQPLYKTRGFYRQYMPAQWNGLHLIVVNGFYASASDIFPDHGADPDQWKHELWTVFGGGCGFWRAVYIVEQNRLMLLQSYGGHRSTVICNGAK
jgi:hypothetical protein